MANRHPWIFSGALEKPVSEIPHGSLVHVTDDTGRILATGTYSAKSMIAVRVLAFDEIEVTTDWFRQRLMDAMERRVLLGIGVGEELTGYRVLFGESDGVPGLVVDRYGDVLVVQFGTAGMELLREPIMEALSHLFAPPAIYERSDLASRSEEGLAPFTGIRHGTLPDTVEFKEDNRRFTADIVNGQKTGFFLDQRDLRREIFSLAGQRRVVDLFSYRGAAGITALAGGAEHVHCVDSSTTALAAVVPQAKLNELDASRIATEELDVFQWLGQRSEPEYGMVLLDPPALIKSRKHIDEGRKGYHFLNRAAMRIIRDRGILVTSSCSFYFTEDELATTLRRAAMQAGVDLHLLKTVRQSPDHPIALNFPESFYLKSFICEVRRG